MKRLALVFTCALLLAACGGHAVAPPLNSSVTSTTQAAPQNGVKHAMSTGCYAAWSASTAYNGGAQVSYKSVNYTAAYWTQNQEPDTNNGPAGSGQPWTSDGSCSGGSTSTPAPTPTPGGGGTGITSGALYRLVNPHSGLVLDETGCSTNNGTNVELWAQSSCYGQVWQPKSNGDGTYTMYNPHSGKVLDVAACGGAGSNVDIWQQTGCNNGGGQKWTIQSNSNGTYTLVNPESTDALDVAGCGTTNGTNVDIWYNGIKECDSGAGQQWTFVPVTASPTPKPTATPTSGGGGGGGGTAPGFIFSPYKDVTVNANWNTGGQQSGVTGTVQPVTNAMPSGDKTMTWAFATGTCGSESWGGISASEEASNVSTYSNAGKDYIVGTGGSAGSFNCDPGGAAFVNFIRTYSSSHMIGVDFDIEVGQSQALVDNLINDVKYAQSNGYGNLRYSFTVATFGGSEGLPSGGEGDMVLRQILNLGLGGNWTIDLMAMDYGGPNSNYCVVVNNSCEMGQSAVQAAVDVHNVYGVAYNHIEVTPMIGGNDSQADVFTIGDVDTLSNGSKQYGFGGIHYWSFDRDDDCAPGSAQTTCNSYGQAGTLGFTNRFISDLGL